MPAKRETSPGTIQRFVAGQPKLSAANLNLIVDRLNAPQLPYLSSEPKLVRTCRDAEGNYPDHTTNPRRYPFRFITVVLNDQTTTGVEYKNSFETPEGESPVPDGTFVNLRPSDPTVALPYRPEGSFLWVIFANGYLWALEPEISVAIFKTPDGGLPGSVSDVAGFAECEMMYINGDGLRAPLEVPNWEGGGDPEIVKAVVHNMGGRISKSYFFATREYGSGRWLAVQSGASSTIGLPVCGTTISGASREVLGSGEVCLFTKENGLIVPQLDGNGDPVREIAYNVFKERWGDEFLPLHEIDGFLFNERPTNVPIGRTTTTPQPNNFCTGGCTWYWVPSNRRWVKVNDSCATDLSRVTTTTACPCPATTTTGDPSTTTTTTTTTTTEDPCACSPPSECGGDEDFNLYENTDCAPAAPNSHPNCGGGGSGPPSNCDCVNLETCTCTWEFNGFEWVLISSTCGSGLLGDIAAGCGRPNDAPSGASCGQTYSSIRPAGPCFSWVANPCAGIGRCVFVYDDTSLSGYRLVDNTCGPNCLCYEPSVSPAGRCSNGGTWITRCQGAAIHTCCEECFGSTTVSPPSTPPPSTTTTDPNAIYCYNSDADPDGRGDLCLQSSSANPDWDIVSGTYANVSECEAACIGITSTPDPSGACCHPVGGVSTCSQTTFSGCVALQGDAYFPGEPCGSQCATTTTAAPDTGACCIESLFLSTGSTGFSCENGMTEDACVNLASAVSSVVSSSWLGVGTSCDSADCQGTLSTTTTTTTPSPATTTTTTTGPVTTIDPSATGACCYQDNGMMNCIQTSSNDCSLIYAGTFFSDTPCSPNPCPPYTP